MSIIAYATFSLHSAARAQEVDTPSVVSGIFVILLILLIFACRCKLARLRFGRIVSVKLMLPREGDPRRNLRSTRSAVSSTARHAARHGTLDSSVVRDDSGVVTLKVRFCRLRVAR